MRPNQKSGPGFPAAAAAPAHPSFRDIKVKSECPKFSRKFSSEGSGWIRRASERQSTTFRACAIFRGDQRRWGLACFVFSGPEPYFASEKAKRFGVYLRSVLYSVLSPFFSVANALFTRGI